MKIGITGTIGSGKTTVCDYLRSLGFYVFDCDKCNKELLQKGNKGYLGVLKLFPEVFDGQELNKQKLADIIFNDKNKKTSLEALLHPLIIEELQNESTKVDPFFAEVPLLFEANLEYLFDHTLLIVCDEDVAIKRLQERNIDYSEAKRRINNQMDVSNKMKRASEIIYNNSTLSSLENEVDKWLNKYVR